MRATILAIIGLICAVTVARAGIVDSPIPAPFVHHLYSVPGVAYDQGTTLTTFFSCTSTSSSPQTVGVEVFADVGGAPVNNAATSALVVAPGQTVKFGTQNDSQGCDSNLAVPAFQGRRLSARVLSTSKSLICTAWAADFAGATPSVAYSLNIFKKTKQKGD